MLENFAKKLPVNDQNFIITNEELTALLEQGLIDTT